MSSLSFTARRISDITSAKTHCLILPIFNAKALRGLAAQVDKAAGGSIKATLALGDFTGKKGQSLVLPGFNNAKRLLLIGCGDASKIDDAAHRGICQIIYNALKPINADDALLAIEDLAADKSQAKRLLSQLAKTLTSADYRYSETLTKPKK